MAESEDTRGQISDGYHTFDELYEHRKLLFVLAMMQVPERSWASRTHTDGSPMYEGWFVAGINLPSGQVTYHLTEDLWHAVERMGLHRNEQPEWDGHTSEDVLVRLAGHVFIGDFPPNTARLRDTAVALLKESLTAAEFWDSHVFTDDLAPRIRAVLAESEGKR